ncbi:iron complex transport system ATP-binding protein [Mumia flava]|uniref:Iron complex transport system ATP-binding protein n=1 Tax=Mumia flava TaxID=1348852 RepID=A0A0B2B9A6_9ACTN|nr:ABC transporter ATP-binding protein [Mumia flava]PJJ53731.1 iron complex transport system ATP-binding protein [Mumia flava]
MSDSATTTTTRLAAERITAGYGTRTVLRDLSLELPDGQVTTIIGPNGCGKSTFVRVLSRLLQPAAGQVTLDGSPLTSLRSRELARRLSMLPQNPVAPEGMTVADLAARGRQPHQPWYRQWSADDEAIAHQAMQMTGVADLREIPLDELSGGQRQRAWIAMVLAQQTDLMILDEPTTHLDLAHAAEVLDVVVELRRTAGKTVVLVLHDLSLAARYSDHLVVLDAGRVVTAGPPAEVLTRDMLADVFGLSAHVFPDPVDGLPTVVPVGHA